MYYKGGFELKRVMAILLIGLLITSISVPSFADLDEKLGNHWSKDEIDSDFLLYYFSYLAREDFKRLEPDGDIREDEFLLSFSSLLKDKGYSALELSFKNELKRIEMVKIVGQKLFELKDVDVDDVVLPFADIYDIDEEEKVILTKLYSIGIIQGQSETKFNPYANTTQAEAVVVLQRVKDYLENVKVVEDNASREIPFTLLGSVQTYSGKEGIVTQVEEDKVIVTITKKFPTPGYKAEIEKIVEENGEYKIYLDITPPDKDSILPQVITYKTITIEINKDDLGDAPYNFVWG